VNIHTFHCSNSHVFEDGYDTPGHAGDVIQYTVYAPCFFLFSFFNGATVSSGSGPHHYRGFMITLRHTTLDMTPLDKWWAWSRDLYLTTHNAQNRQTSMPLAGFEPTIPASERPHTHALEHSATGTGMHCITFPNLKNSEIQNTSGPKSFR
jgi:hypothetical protein